MHARQFGLERVLDIGERLADRQLDVHTRIGVELGLVDHVRHGAVAQEHDVAVAVVDLGGAHADLHDGSRGGAHLDDVAHAELAVKDDEESAEQVGNEVLGAKAHREGDDAGTGEERCRVHAEHAQAPVEHAEEHAVLDGAREQAADGLAASSERVGEQAEEPADNRSDGDGHACVHDGGGDGKDVEPTGPAALENIGEHGAGAEHLVFEHDGGKDEERAETGEPAEHAAELLLGGLLGPREGAVEPARDGGVAALDTAVAEGHVDIAARGGGIGVRRLLCGACGRGIAFGVEGEHGKDHSQASERHAGGRERERAALGHELAFGTGHVDVVVVGFDAVGKVGLAAHGDVVAKAVAELVLGKAGIGSRFALNGLCGEVRDLAARLFDGKGKAVRAHLDTA